MLLFLTYSLSCYFCIEQETNELLFFFMQFKIDAKDQYTVITPQKGILDKEMAAHLAEQCTQLSDSGSENFIIDLSLCQDVHKDFLSPLIELASAQYEAGQSFVLTNISPETIRIIKEEDAIDSINYAPSFNEAADIVSMEILERDLFNEED